MQVLSRLVSKDMMANMPYFQGLGLNAHAGAFAAVLARFNPVFRCAHHSYFVLGMRAGLTEGGRTSAGTFWRRMGAHLVVIELATAMVLLSGAGLLGKSLYRLLHVDFGFQPDHLATLRVALPDLQYPKDDQKVAFTRRMIERVEGLPGVQSAA